MPAIFDTRVLIADIARKAAWNRQTLPLARLPCQTIPGLLNRTPLRIWHEEDNCAMEDLQYKHQTSGKPRRTCSSQDAHRMRLNRLSSRNGVAMQEDTCTRTTSFIHASPQQAAPRQAPPLLVGPSNIVAVPMGDNENVVAQLRRTVEEMAQDLSNERKEMRRQVEEMAQELATERQEMLRQVQEMAQELANERQAKEARQNWDTIFSCWSSFFSCTWCVPT